MAARRPIIASLNSNYAELVRKTRSVALADGINFRDRKAHKIIKRVSG